MKTLLNTIRRGTVKKRYGNYCEVEFKDIDHPKQIYSRKQFGGSLPVVGTKIAAIVTIISLTDE